MKRVYPVVILQTSRVGFSICKVELEAAHLPAESYLLTDSVEEATDEVVSGELQILITGTILGSIEMAEEFARQMRKKNSELVVANFSTMDDGSAAKEPYHLTIKKDYYPGTQEACRYLVEAMMRFLALVEQRQKERVN